MTFTNTQTKLGQAITTNDSGDYAVRTIIEGDQTMANLTLTGTLAMATTKLINWASGSVTLGETAANTMTVAGATTWDMGAVDTLDFDANVNITGGKVGINETINTGLTLGLTINQAANDDEILALKSSDVAHGVTTITETDTYGMFKKDDAAGILKMVSLHPTSSIGMRFQAIAPGTNATKSTAGRSTIEFDAADINGTGIQDKSSSENIFSVRNNATARFLIGADGALWAGATFLDSSANLASANGANFGPADATSFTVVNGIVTAIS